MIICPLDILPLAKNFKLTKTEIYGRHFSNSLLIKTTIKIGRPSAAADSWPARRPALLEVSGVSRPVFVPPQRDFVAAGRGQKTEDPSSPEDFAAAGRRQRDIPKPRNSYPATRNPYPVTCNPQQFIPCEQPVDGF